MSDDIININLPLNCSNFTSIIQSSLQVIDTDGSDDEVE
jgi:hypothetical protein